MRNGIHTTLRFQKYKLNNDIAANARTPMLQSGRIATNEEGSSLLTTLITNELKFFESKKIRVIYKRY